jgi:hypothetical protein
MPITPSSSDPVGLAAGRAGACATLAGGAVFCWGDAAVVADGRPASSHPRCTVSQRPCVATPARIQRRSDPRLPPFPFVVASATGVTMSGDRVVALDGSGGPPIGWGATGDGVATSLVIDGIGGTPVTAVALAADTTFAGGPFLVQWLGWGANAFAEVREPVGPVEGATTIPITLGATTLRAAGHHVCMFNPVRCWGANARGQSGAPPSHHVGPAAPATITMPSVVFDDLAVTPNASCAIDGGAVWCWGSRDALGAGDAMLDECGGACTHRAVRAHLPAQAVALVGSTDADTFCVLTTSGAVWCWGDNRAHALGGTLPAIVLTPTVVPALARARTLAIGDGFLCGIVDRRVHCAGANDAAQLGRSTSSPEEPFAPVLIPAL